MKGKFEEKVDEKRLEQAKKKLKEGWIRTSMMIECLGGSKQAAKSALEKHIEKLGKEKGVIVYRTVWHEIQKVENPWKGLDVAYSYMVELEMMASTFDKLMYMVMNYGPTNIEVLEPKEIKIPAGEAQGILVSISDIIHQFARQGAGGVVIQS